MKLTILLASLLICSLNLANWNSDKPDNYSACDKNTISEFGYDTIPDTILHVSEIREVIFTSGHFTIYGNLYLPANINSTHPLVIWVSGSGASYRTVRNPDTKKLINCFLDNGVAYFRIDKPGYGASNGNLNEDSLFIQLSAVITDAINSLIKLPIIDSTKIGLFGSSQAGYIMPIAAEKSKKISFIIGSSLPGENSIDQWNYLIEKQMLCEGYSEQSAKKNIEMFTLLRCSDDKKQFDAALEYFSENPMIIKSVGYDSTFAEGAKTWWPRKIDVTHKSYFNPVSIIEKIKIPIFLVYGANDTQIDPFQAIDAYKAAFNKSRNNKSRIVLLNNTDHNMSINETGCLSEIERLQKAKLYNLNEEYLDTISTWINKLIKD